jgi:hypothetical protein
MLHYRPLRRVALVRNDGGEGNGGSKDKKRENQGDKEFHGEISLSIRAAS